jgi:hypothetical protein
MKLFFPSTSLNTSTRDTYLCVMGCNFTFYANFKGIQKDEQH